MTFSDTIAAWANYYFMSGGAAAGLIGLMFVAVSLGANILTPSNQDDDAHFTTPSVTYLVTALILSCIMLVPVITAPALIVMLLIGGGGGLVFALWHGAFLIRIAFRHNDFNLFDWLSQIILPVVSQGALVGAAAALTADQVEAGLIAVWLADLLLLLIGIGNTWSLVTWIARNRSGDLPKQDQSP